MIEVEPADQVEQELAAALRERQVAEFIEHHQVDTGELAGQGAGLAGTALRLEPVGEIDGGEEPAAADRMTLGLQGGVDARRTITAALLSMNPTEMRPSAPATAVSHRYQGYPGTDYGQAVPTSSESCRIEHRQNTEYDFPIGKTAVWGKLVYKF